MPCLEPRNRRPTDVVAPGQAALRLAGGGQLRSHDFDSAAIRRYSGLLTASRHRPQAPLPGSLPTGGAGLYPEAVAWEPDHVPQHQDLVQFRSAGDR